MNNPEFLGGNAVLLALAAFVLLCVFLGVRIVPQSEKHVVERFGRLRAVLGPGINFIVPFLDKVAHRISVLERQLPTHKQDAITADNVLPVGVLVFPGTGIQENLADKARKLGIPVMKFDGGA